MSTPFDPGYGQEPFRTLVRDVPDSTVFPRRTSGPNGARSSTEDDWTEPRDCSSSLRTLPNMKRSFGEPWWVAPATGFKDLWRSSD